MSAPLKIGDKVICQFYNTPDHRFYGRTFEAVIISTNAREEYTPPRQFAVRRTLDNTVVTLDRREILRRSKG